MLATGRYRTTGTREARFALGLRPDGSGVWRWHARGAEALTRWGKDARADDAEEPLKTLLALRRGDASVSVVGPKAPRALRVTTGDAEVLVAADTKLVMRWPGCFEMNALLTDAAALELDHARAPATLAEAMALRVRVFVGEQRVPLELEHDDDDARALHVTARLRGLGTLVATGRMVHEGRFARIGRMAVDADWRGLGLGAALLVKLEQAAELAGFSQAMLHAQLHAEVFYARAGYARHGDEFDEAGIRHVEMRKVLASGG